MPKRPTGPRLAIVPQSLASAQAFVARVHRHHRPSPGHKFSVGVVDEAGTLRGVAMVGRPVARNSDDGWTLEVNRVATDGCVNACSALYGAAMRTAKALGYRRILTYTLPAEGGASLRASGWTNDGEGGGGRWTGTLASGNERANNHPLGLKTRWVKVMGETPTEPPPVEADSVDDRQASLFGLGAA